MARQDAPTPFPDADARLERSLGVAVVAGLVAAALLGWLSIFLLTLGYDEAWILLAIQAILGDPNPDLALPPPLTSGGVYAAGQLLVTALAGNAVWAHRLVSFVCLLAGAAIVFAWARPRAGSTLGGLLALAPPLAAPGTLVLGASAYAAVPAVLTLLAAIAAWEATPERRTLRWLLVGSLTGLAAATRINCAVAIPAWLVWALLERAGRRERCLDALAVGVVAAVVLAGATWLLDAAAPAEAATAEAARRALGTSQALFDPVRLLNRWVTANGFLPLFIGVGATLVAQRLTREEPRGWGSAWLLLVPLGWLLWASWIARSPIPHLRYLWPACVCFAVVLGLGLARLYGAGGPGARVAALSLALACVATTLGTGLRNVSKGDLNLLTREWSRQTPAGRFHPFQYLRDQRAAARYVSARVAPRETIGVVGLDYELRYLTGHRLVPLKEFRRGGGWAPDLPRRILVPPSVGTYVYLRPRGFLWVEQNCALDARIGRYWFYRVLGDYPAASATLMPHRMPEPMHPFPPHPPPRS